MYTPDDIEFLTAQAAADEEAELAYQRMMEEDAYRAELAADAEDAERYADAEPLDVEHDLF